MNKVRFNFQRPDTFEWKFKRKPKFRTLVEIQDLYLRSYQRSKERIDNTKSTIIEIVNQISPCNGKYLVYFYIENKLRQYEISYSNEFGSYISSSSETKFINKDINKNRSHKISFILNNELAFKLGKKYRENILSNYHHHNTIKHAFNIMLIDELNRKYEGIKVVDIPRVISVLVGERKHIVSIDDNSSYGNYKKFIYNGVLTDEIILK